MMNSPHLKRGIIEKYNISAPTLNTLEFDNHKPSWFDAPSSFRDPMMSVPRAKTIQNRPSIPNSKLKQSVDRFVDNKGIMPVTNDNVRYQAKDKKERPHKNIEVHGVKPDVSENVLLHMFGSTGDSNVSMFDN